MKNTPSEKNMPASVSFAPRLGKCSVSSMILNDEIRNHRPKSPAAPVTSPLVNGHLLLVFSGMLFSGFITFVFEGIHHSRTDPFPEKNSQSLTIASVSRAQYLSSWEWISALRSVVVSGLMAS
jgi:hypothetical protein